MNIFYRGPSPATNCSSDVVFGPSHTVVGGPLPNPCVGGSGSVGAVYNVTPNTGNNGIGLNTTIACD